MAEHPRRLAMLALMFFLLIGSAVCTNTPSVSGQSRPAATSSPTKAAAPKPAVNPKAPSLTATNSVSPPVVITKGEGASYTLEYKWKPGDVSYLSIENEFRESGGVQPLLSYTTTTKERRFIIQRVLPPTSQPAGTGKTSVQWECDRYEAREKSMKDEAVYDSLKHLYPPPSLSMIGTIPGSKVTFQIDSAGNSSAFLIGAGPTSGGPPGRGSSTKTTEKCQLTQENMKKLLDDLGPFFFPREPVQAGAVWSYKIVDVQRNIGVFTTLVKCTLRGVRSVEGRELITIDISGDVSLVADKILQPAPTSRPGHPTTAPAKPREFKLDRFACTGSVDFDLTRGELVQLNLRRETGVSSEIDGQAMGPMKLTSGTAQNLKVSVSRTPTPKPVIVGGKIAPPMPKEDPHALAGLRTPIQNAAASQPTTMRAGPANTKKSPDMGGSSPEPVKNPTKPAGTTLPTKGGRRTNELDFIPPPPTTRPVARLQPVTPIRTRSVLTPTTKPTHSPLTTTRASEG
ncbi:MAG: hypothetical protein AABZ08_04300 [Planctomycetota bacterium]